MFPLRLCRSKKLFSFHLQITTCFHEVSCFHCGMTQFNADTVPWYSDKVRLAEWKAKERVRKWGDKMREREREKGGALIERLWLAVFSRPSGPVTWLQRGCCFSRCSQGEVCALERFLHHRRPHLFIPQFLSPPSHTFYAPPTKSIWLCKVQHGPGECRLAVGDRRRA